MSKIVDNVLWFIKTFFEYGMPFLMIPLFASYSNWPAAILSMAILFLSVSVNIEKKRVSIEHDISSFWRKQCMETLHIAFLVTGELAKLKNKSMTQVLDELEIEDSPSLVSSDQSATSTSMEQ